MKISAKKRDVTGKKVKNLRKENLVPASVYGPKRKPENISLDPKEFKHVQEVSGSKLIELEVEGEKSTKVIIKEVQEDPIRDQYLHVSLYEVDPTAKLTTNINIVVEGFAPAVKNNIGVLVSSLNMILVRCLPKDIPSDFIVDVSNLAEIGDSILVSDLKLPEGVELANPEIASLAIINIAPPQKEIVEEVVVAATEGEEESTAEVGEAEKTEETKEA